MDTSKFKGIFPALCEVGGKTWARRKVIDKERGGYADIAADTKTAKYIFCTKPTSVQNFTSPCSMKTRFEIIRGKIL